MIDIESSQDISSISCSNVGSRNSSFNLQRSPKKCNKPLQGYIQELTLAGSSSAQMVLLEKMQLRRLSYISYNLTKVLDKKVPYNM